MRRGEVYRTRERVVERGDKPGFYVIVSRLMFKHKLKTLAGRLSLVKLRELDGALARALDLPDRV
ncbi:MAG: hypothetical protein HYS05_04290 [Acidobacteria bacterium]|nr:hypothetical protein [Acidobacteriota bacterium]